MEKIGEGYLSGFDLHLDNDEREILKNSLFSHLQFCFFYPDLGLQEVLCKNLLRKLGFQFDPDVLVVKDLL